MNVETLDCDVCGAKIADFENDLFHYSGKLHGKQSTHIHLCAKCESDLKPPFFDFDAALEKKRSRELVTLILKTAGAYDEWLTSNRRGSSFSTFVNEFGFDGENSSAIFAKVEETRKDLLSRCIG